MPNAELRSSTAAANCNQMTSHGKEVEKQVGLPFSSSAGEVIFIPLHSPPRDRHNEQQPPKGEQQNSQLIRTEELHPADGSCKQQMDLIQPSSAVDIPVKGKIMEDAWCQTEAASEKNNSPFVEKSTDTELDNLMISLQCDDEDDDEVHFVCSKQLSEDKDANGVEEKNASVKELAEAHTSGVVNFCFFSSCTELPTPVQSREHEPSQTDKSGRKESNATGVVVLVEVEKKKKEEEGERKNWSTAINMVDENMVSEVAQICRIEEMLASAKRDCKEELKLLLVPSTVTDDIDQVDDDEDGEFPYVATTLPLERPKTTPLCLKRHNSILQEVTVSADAIERPRSTTPLHNAATLLDQYVTAVKWMPLPPPLPNDDDEGDNKEEPQERQQQQLGACVSQSQSQQHAIIDFASTQRLRITLPISSSLAQSKRRSSEEHAASGEPCKEKSASDCGSLKKKNMKKKPWKEFVEEVPPKSPKRKRDLQGVSNHPETTEKWVRFDAAQEEETAAATALASDGAAARQTPKRITTLRSHQQCGDDGNCDSVEAGRSLQIVVNRFQKSASSKRNG